MGKIRSQTSSKHLDFDGYTVGFEFSAHDQDPAPPFTGLPDDVCQARLGRGHGRQLGPRPTRFRVHSPHRHVAWWALQTLRRPYDLLSIRESVTEPALEAQLEIAGSGGHG